MAHTFTKDATEWLNDSLRRSASDFDFIRMAGSTSSSVFLLNSFGNENGEKFVLRVLDNSAWLAMEPDLAEHEAAALEEARRAGVSAPKLVAYSSEDVGFGAPVVLMTFLEGQIELRPANFREWLRALAFQLAFIHRHQPPSSFPWLYGSWLDQEKLIVPEWTTRPDLWERAIELILHQLAPASPAVYLHRDYHPTNVLWQKEKISGVVDWINACSGPAGVDVAHCRINLTQMYGVAAADDFLAAYAESARNFTYHPYWDVASVLDSALPRPEFYKPWAEFGLSRIAPNVLRDRIESYLRKVLS